MKRKMTEKDKRAVIYEGERLKAISMEIDNLRFERKGLKGLTKLDEAQKRRQIYVTEQVSRLETERNAILETRKTLTS